MRQRQVRCQTPDEACRLLLAVATGEVERRYVARTLRAVAQWIVDDQVDQANVRAGMARMMLDAARVVGASGRRGV